MDDLHFHLRALSRFIFYVTDEEDRLLLKLRSTFDKFIDQVYLYNSAAGLVPLKNWIDDWKLRKHPEDQASMPINEALMRVYKDDPRDKQNYYIITDAERFLAEANVQRRILNIAQQLHNDEKNIKVMIFVGQRAVIPPKLQRYIEVVHDPGLNDDEISRAVGEISGLLKTNPPRNSPSLFRGLTHFEIDAAIAQSIVAYRRNNKGAEDKRIEEKYIRHYKRKMLKKSDLLSYVDTADSSFDKVGGAEHFKAWAAKTKNSWTEEGQRFGLRPPKGVMLVGVWGCGKSISVKALGAEWKLPVIQLEMGKLRNSGVGDSEANAYKVINLIEAQAPCIVWLDEAEKSLAGAASSAMSDSGTTSRMLGIFSTWIEETKSEVCWAMTANSLRGIPTEFINRMDERFFFDLPNDEERIDILKIHLKAFGQDTSKFQLADLSDYAKNMVGREIGQSIAAAMIDSFHANKENLDPEILAQALKTKPRIFKTMGEDIKELLDWVGYDADTDEGIRARFASAKRGESFRNR